MTWNKSPSPDKNHALENPQIGAWVGLKQIGSSRVLFSFLFCVFCFDFPGSCWLPVPTALWGNESFWASGKILTFLKIFKSLRSEIFFVGHFAGADFCTSRISLVSL